MLTRYHSDSYHIDRHSLDDDHHPVPITKNNFGLLTFQRMDFRSLLREDFLSALLVHLSPNRELADNSANVLVPIIAFD